MKTTRIFIALPLLLGLALPLFADLEPGRPLESNSLIWRPEKAARETDFRIILISSLNRDVENHILLIAPDGKTSLIDAGQCTAYPELTKTFDKYGIRHIDQVILTHHHDDHVGGLPAILPMEKYTFGEILWQMISDEELDCEGEGDANRLRIQQIQERAAARGTPIREVKMGDVIDFGSGAKGTILMDNQPELHKQGINNKSLVIRFVYGEFSMLFTGDMCTEEWDVIYARGISVKSTVLETGHHGGAYGTCPSFLKAVAPKAAVSSMPEWLSHDERGIDTDNMIHAEGIPHFRAWEASETGELVIATDGIFFFITPYGKAPAAPQSTQQP